MMLLFDIFIILIESLIFSYFLTKFFHIIEEKKSIFLFGILFFISNLICFGLNENGFLLWAVSMIIAVTTLIYFTKKISFQIIYIPFLYYILVVAMSLIPLFIGASLFGMDPTQFISDEIRYVCTVSVSKILLCVSTWITLRLKVKVDFSLNMRQWWLLLMKEALLIAAISILATSIIENTMSMTHYVVILLILCVVSFLSILSVYKTNKINDEKIRQAKSLQNLKHQQQNVKMVKDLKMDIDALNHRMFYILVKVQQDLLAKNYDKAICTIENFKQVTIKQDIFIHTNNETFDALINLKMKEMKSQSDVKCCMTIDKHSIYDEMNFINGLFSVLNFVSKSKNIDLFISEKAMRVTIKVYFNSFDQTEESKAYKLIKEAFDSFKNIIIVDFTSEIQSIKVMLTIQE